MMRYVLFMGVNKCHFQQFIDGLQNSVPVRNQSKMPPYSGRPRSAVTKSNINKIKSIIEKDARFTVRQLAQMTNLGLASVHFILKKILKVTKISARWIPHLLTDEQKRTRVQMAKQLLKKYPKYQKKVFDSCLLYTSPSPRDLSTSRMPSSA